MKNMNNLERVREALIDLMEGQDPVQDKPLSRFSAAGDEAVRSCLRRINCFLQQIIARNVPADLPPFFLTAEQQGRLVPADRPVRQTELLRQINRAAEGNACRSLTGRELISWLVEQELFLPFPEEDDLYFLGPEGEAAGIYYQRTDEFPTLYFDPSAQQFLLGHIADLVQHAQSFTSCMPPLTVHPKLLPAAVRGMELLSRGCHPETGEALSPEDPLCQEALQAAFVQATEVLRRAMETGLFPV